MSPPRLLLALALAAVGGPSAARAAAKADSYVFTYFTGNGEDGLHLAWSADGHTWVALNGGKSLLAPRVGKSRLMRDPCVVRGPDGIFRLVWTSGWNEDDIGYASSPDLIHWSEEKAIPVMAQEPKVRNSWAPEVHYDARRGDYLIFWASTIPGRFPATAGSSEDDYNHRIYSTTTKDFVTFTPTRLFFDPGFSVIDATILPADGRYYLIFKDETVKPPRKYLQLAVSDDMEGPYGSLSAPISPPGLWAEGPTAIRIGDEYFVYFDAYMKKHYGALRSRDLKTWDDVTAEMKFPDEGTPGRLRHGTVIEVPEEIASALLRLPAP